MNNLDFHYGEMSNSSHLHVNFHSATESNHIFFHCSASSFQEVSKCVPSSSRDIWDGHDMYVRTLQDYQTLTLLFISDCFTTAFAQKVNFRVPEESLFVFKTCN